MIEENLSSKQYTYLRHQPEETELYKIIQNNWLAFQQQAEQELGNSLPDFVLKEFEEYLRCGIRRMSETAARQSGSGF